MSKIIFKPLQQFNILVVYNKKTGKNSRLIIMYLNTIKLFQVHDLQPLSIRMDLQKGWFEDLLNLS